jgi:toxin-antitoxin system PIN domain toxin
MILVDANLLVYAYNQAAPEHAAASRWFEETMNGSERVGLPLSSVVAFVRLMSNPLVVARPIAPAAAWRTVQSWLQRDNVWIAQAGTSFPEILAELLEDTGMTSNLVSDAHLGALAIEHGAIVHSTDADFSRFKNVRWKNPLRN